MTSYLGVLFIAMKTIQKHLRMARIQAAALVVFLTLVIGVGSVLAIAVGYSTDDSELKPGMVAGLSEGSTSEKPKVERAAFDNEAKIIGVTTTPDEELVTIASGDQQVYVETTGEVETYVSDLTGEVRAGDLLSLSPLRGILMRADSNPAIVIGIALEDFDAAAAEKRTINDGTGQKEVKIAKVKINLDHKAASNQQAGIVDSSLRRLGRAVTGKEVGEVRVVIALIIFLAVLVAEGGIIYGAVSSALVALGRNPMARKIIQKEMFRVILIALAVLLVGLAAIYIILWI